MGLHTVIELTNELLHRHLGLTQTGKGRLGFRSPSLPVKRNRAQHALEIVVGLPQVGKLHLDGVECVQSRSRCRKLLLHLRQLILNPLQIVQLGGHGSASLTGCHLANQSASTCVRDCNGPNAALTCRARRAR